LCFQKGLHQDQQIQDVTYFLQQVHWTFASPKKGIFFIQYPLHDSSRFSLEPALADDFATKVRINYGIRLDLTVKQISYTPGKTPRKEPPIFS
jgi:hypothetical protein